MSNTHDEQSLSLLEQAILVRLPSKRSIRFGDLIKDIAAFSAAERQSDLAHAAIDAAIAELRCRGFVHNTALRSTRAGEKALRDALGARRAPTWPQFCRMLASRALGLPPASDQAKKTFDSAGALALAVLRQRAPLPPGNTMMAVCDALVTEILGLPPGKVTLARIRQHALARRIGAIAAGGPVAAAASALQARGTDKASLIQALACRVIDLELTPRRPGAEPPSVTPGDQALLSLVHEAMAHVGPAGRVGPEKVFVSAIWHQIAADRRASDLSLDGFKRWLVLANREQLLALERADAVGAMDPRLVAESEIEIENVGSTFHFVVDPQNRAQAAGL